jgi:hypothetical protein
VSFALLKGVSITTGTCLQDIPHAAITNELPRFLLYRILPITSHEAFLGHGDKDEE